MNTKLPIKKILLLSLAFACLFSYASVSIERHIIAKKRQDLANTMNVSLDQYPFLPKGYLTEKVKEGMPMEEAHKIIVGYEKVYNNADRSEVYYFFSIEDDQAIRIEVLYDENFNVQKVITEDSNSRLLTSSGWAEGLLVR